MTRGWTPIPPQPPKRRSRWPVWCIPCILLAMALIIHRPAQVDTRAYPLHAPVLTPEPQPVQTLPEGIRAGLPQGERQTLSVPAQHLMKGRMLLIDETHPLPEGYAPGDTFSVLNHTQGRVTCRDLTAVSGQDTLQALAELFAAARQARIVQYTVFAGTRSADQQRILLTDTLADLSRDMPLEDALRAAREAVASVDCTEHQTPWAIDLRLCPVWNGAPLEEAFEASAAGRWLTEHCWEYGFIRRWPQAQPSGYSCHAWHFRYVGRAHAMLMHTLDASFEEYLALLRQHGSLTLYNENGAPLAAAICQRAGEHLTSFTLPLAQIDDLSLDNTGYAIASCLFTECAEVP
ncbi:MAG: D-alanyl-D-alanine carboxypeptidase family protein [Clostridiales bacterium]|nr:D-alanyl-D-alanine carboxypeptidase family protein [Clostridiales bacterium]